MDKGMKSAFCETGRAPGRVAEVIESPEDCARVLNEYFL